MFVHHLTNLPLEIHTSNKIKQNIDNYDNCVVLLVDQNN